MHDMYAQTPAWRDLAKHILFAVGIFALVLISVTSAGY
jgi:hypothetical protein